MTHLYGISLLQFDSMKIAKYKSISSTTSTFFSSVIPRPSGRASPFVISSEVEESPFQGNKNLCFPGYPKKNIGLPLKLFLFF